MWYAMMKLIMFPKRLLHSRWMAFVIVTLMRFITFFLHIIYVSIFNTNHSRIFLIHRYRILQTKWKSSRKITSILGVFFFGGTLSNWWQKFLLARKHFSFRNDSSPWVDCRPRLSILYVEEKHSSKLLSWSMCMRKLISQSFIQSSLTFWPLSCFFLNRKQNKTKDISKGQIKGTKLQLNFY